MIQAKYYYAFSTGSLVDQIEGMENDYAIIERELKRNNPHFDHDEQSLHIELGELSINDEVGLLHNAHEYAVKYGLEYIQIWKKAKLNQWYDLGIEFKVYSYGLEIYQILTGYFEDWNFKEVHYAIGSDIRLMEEEFQDFSGDYAIIKKELEKGNPDFNSVEKALFIEEKVLAVVNDESWLLKEAHKVAVKYGLKRIEIYKKNGANSSYTDGVQFQVTKKGLIYTSVLGGFYNWIFEANQREELKKENHVIKCETPYAMEGMLVECTANFKGFKKNNIYRVVELWEHGLEEDGAILEDHTKYQEDLKSGCADLDDQYAYYEDVASYDDFLKMNFLPLDDAYYKSHTRSEKGFRFNYMNVSPNPEFSLFPLTVHLVEKT